MKGRLSGLSGKSICLASVQPWVQTPVPQKKKELEEARCDRQQRWWKSRGLFSTPKEEGRVAEARQCQNIQCRKAKSPQ
jgi:hypothetical protein